MGLLAADRKKQRWSGDPRGKNWSSDKNKISNKMMEKMGWKDGQGLGAKGEGMLNPIGIKYKMDNLGFGCTQKYDKQWIEHQDSFNDLLAGLNEATGNDVKAVIRLADTVEVSSLEDTGKKLGHRYKKATRAKDISKASAKDMEGIFGRSSESEKKAEADRLAEAEKEESEDKPKFEESSKHVRQTETVQDYFKRKMAERTERLKLAAIKSEVKTEPENDDDTPLARLMTSEVDVKNEPPESADSEDLPKKSKKKKKNKTVDVKSEPVDDTPEVAEDDKIEEPTVVKKKKKKRKSAIEVEPFEQNETTVESISEEQLAETGNKSKRKKKKKSKNIEGESEEIVSVETTEGPTDEANSSPPSKKKKRKKEAEICEVAENNEITKVKKSKKKKTKD